MAEICYEVFEEASNKFCLKPWRKTLVEIVAFDQRVKVIDECVLQLSFDLLVKDWLYVSRLVAPFQIVHPAVNVSIRLLHVVRDDVINHEHED